MQFNKKKPSIFMFTLDNASLKSSTSHRLLIFQLLRFTITLLSLFHGHRKAPPLPTTDSDFFTCRYFSAWPVWPLQWWSHLRFQVICLGSSLQKITNAACVGGKLLFNKPSSQRRNTRFFLLNFALWASYRWCLININFGPMLWYKYQCL